MQGKGIWRVAVYDPLPQPTFSVAVAKPASVYEWPKRYPSNAEAAAAAASTYQGKLWHLAPSADKYRCAVSPKPLL